MMFSPLNGGLLNGGPLVFTIAAALSGVSTVKGEIYVERYQEAVVIAEASTPSQAYKYSDFEGVILACSDTPIHDFTVLAHSAAKKAAYAEASMEGLAERPFYAEVLSKASFGEAPLAVIKTFGAGPVFAEAHSLVDALAERPFLAPDIDAYAVTPDAYFTRWAGFNRKVFSSAISYINRNYVYAFTARVIQPRVTITGRAYSWAIHTHAILDTPDYPPPNALSDGCKLVLRDMPGGTTAYIDTSLDNTYVDRRLLGQADPFADIISEPDFIIDGVTYKRNSALFSGVAQLQESWVKFSRPLARLESECETSDVTMIPHRAHTGLTSAGAVMPLLSVKHELYGYMDVESEVSCDIERLAYVDAELVAVSYPVEVFNSLWAVFADHRSQIIAEASIAIAIFNRTAGFNDNWPRAFADAQLTAQRATNFYGTNGFGDVAVAEVIANMLFEDSDFDGWAVADSYTHARVIFGNYYPAPDHRSFTVQQIDKTLTVSPEDRTLTL